jgi:hypothetical protein
MGARVLELKTQIPIKSGSFKNVKSFVPKYLTDVDTFILRPSGKSIPAVSIDIEGEWYLRINPDTGEIVGVEIEDFEKYFIKKYPEFGVIWKQAKKSVGKSNCNDKNTSTFVSIVYDLLADVLKDDDTPQLLYRGAI